MKNMADSIRILARQLDRLKDIPCSEELLVTMRELGKMMKEVVDFIQNWLKTWSGAYSVV